MMRTGVFCMLNDNERAVIRFVERFELHIR